MEHMCVSSQQIHIYDACEGHGISFSLSRVTVGHCVGGTLAQVLSSCCVLGGAGGIGQMLLHGFKTRLLHSE